MREGRKPIRTTKEEIIDYWVRQGVDECDLSVDWAEADSHCWRCGCERNLERCHIVPDSLGGKDEPSNLVLLCKRCHADGPNVADPEIMWDWIKSYKVAFYDTFWSIQGAAEYFFIYGKRVSQEVKDIIASAEGKYSQEEIEKIYSEVRMTMNNSASQHFGQPYFNTATMAGMMRMSLKEFAARLGVPFPVPGKESVRSGSKWMDLL